MKPTAIAGAVRAVSPSWLGALALLTACAPSLGSAPNLGGLYDRAAQADDSLRNPVIVIPGVLGSKLRDEETGRVVWGAFSGVFANPARPDGARLVALPMEAGVPLADLRDEVVPDGVLDQVRLRLFGVPLQLKAYFYILSVLGVGGYRDETLGQAGTVRYAPGHFTCFQFDYDWRRDNAENAARLDRFIREKKAYVEAELERRTGVPHDVRFDVIAHSMGGLLLRYYLRYGAATLPADGSLPELTWAGAANVERAVLVGTPNAGSAHAFLDLVDGVRFSIVLPRYDATVLGTMPSLYELLPRARHGAVVEGGGSGGKPIDIFDPAQWERYGWGLASAQADTKLAILLPEVAGPEERRRIALDHLRKALAAAKQFHAALDLPAEPPPGTTLHLFAGDARDTVAVVAVDPLDGSLQVAESGPGDETVLRTSALLDERVGNKWAPGVVSPIRWRSVTFLFADHLALTRDPAFTDNLLYRLLESPRSPSSGPQAAAAPGVGE